MQKLQTSKKSEIPPNPDLDEEEQLVNNPNPHMESPKMPTTGERYNFDSQPHDLEVIDSRLKDDYSNREVYSGTKEAGCFKNCYVCCGKIPQNLCCLCGPCGCGPKKIISQGEIGLLIRFGRVIKKLPPGLHTINPCTDKLIVVDMRLNSIKSVQQFTTKDNLTAFINIFGTWKITHPELFYFKVDDLKMLMNNLIRGVMCTAASTNTLDNLMLKREHIQDICLKNINIVACNFGFIFENIEFNEITLPPEILHAVSASALAQRNAEAKLIEAQAEIDSALMYKEAADQVSANPVSLQLQWLETMKDIAKTTMSTLVLPDTVIGSWKKIMKGDEKMT